MNSKFWLNLSAIATCLAFGDLSGTITNFPALADTSSTDYLFIVDQPWQDCRHFGEAYQEIKSFETANFYINLCQKEDQYFYAGKAKNNGLESTFIPAYATEQLNTYQADNGNISYIVEIQPTEAILRIQRNGNTVIVENSLSQNCPQVNYEPKFQIAQELNYSNYQVQSFSGAEGNSFAGRIFVNSDNENSENTEISVLNQLSITDTPKQKAFTYIPKQLSNFGDCFLR